MVVHANDDESSAVSVVDDGDESSVGSAEKLEGGRWEGWEREEGEER